MGHYINIRYKIDDLVLKAQELSLYHEDGRDKDFNTISMGTDDFPFVKTLVKMACVKAFEEAQSLATDKDEMPFEFDIELFDDDAQSLGEGWVIIRLMFPPNYNEKSVSILGGACEDFIIQKTFYDWVNKKGRRDLKEKQGEDMERARIAFKQALNYRTSLSKIYNWY